VGDHVIIKSLRDCNSKIIGKIEEIYEENGIKIFKYNEFYFPEKTTGNFIFIL
jgi:hypothetical protein